jgi:hypothetical protein
MSTQQALALPSPVASNTVVINARCSLRIEADQRVIVVGGIDQGSCTSTAMCAPITANAPRTDRLTPVGRSLLPSPCERTGRADEA